MCAKKSGSGRGGGRGRGGGVGPGRRPEPAVSAFEQAARSKGRKRKFPLLGQKQAPPKAKDDGGEARSRKAALLVEYKGMRKSNKFVDRRFGGAPDPTDVPPPRPAVGS